MNRCVSICNAGMSFNIDKEAFLLYMERVCQEEQQEINHIHWQLTNHETIKNLHSKYSHDATTTDVLAFAYSEKGQPLWGDIVVNNELAYEDCENYGYTYHEEVFLYCIHGLLHLIGYDDKNEQQREVMRAKESYYMKASNFQSIFGQDCVF